MARSPNPTPPKAGGKYYGVGHGGLGGQLVFSDLDGAVLASVIQAVTDDGDAITFSRTKDGGAVGVSVLSDGRVHKWYAADQEELATLLDSLLGAAGVAG